MDAHKDLTEGSEYKNLMFLAVPGAVGRFFENIYHIINMVWIGLMGGAFATQAQAGIVIFGTANSIHQMLNNMFGPGSVTIISRFWGARDYQRSAWASEQTITLKFLIGLLGAVAGIFTLKYLLLFAGADTAIDAQTGRSVMQVATVYGRILLWELPIVFVYYTLNTIFRCTSDAPSSMALNIIASLINTILDPIFILGLGPIPKMGIAGVAYATLISHTTADVIGMWLLLNGKKLSFKRYTLLVWPYIRNDRYYYRIRLPYFKVAIETGGLKISWKGLLRIDFGLFWNFMRIGVVPTITQFVASSFSFVYMNVVSSFGKEFVAAFGIQGRLAGLVNMPLLGFQQAAGALVGQNLGAKKPQRAEKTAWISAYIGMGLGALLVLVALLFPKQIFSIFSSDPKVLEVGATIFALSMFGNMLNAGQWMLASVFDGSGYTMWPSILSQANSWLLNILPAVILVKFMHFDYRWLLYIGIFASASQLAISITLVRKRRWIAARV